MGKLKRETNPKEEEKRETWIQGFFKLPTVGQWVSATLITGALIVLMFLWSPLTILPGIAAFSSWFTFMVLPTVYYIVFFQLIPSLFCEVELMFVGKGPFLPKMLGYIFGGRDRWVFGSKELTSFADMILMFVCGDFMGFFTDIMDRLKKVWKEWIKDPMGTVAIYFIRVFNIIVGALGDVIGGVSGICDVEPITPLSEIIDFVLAPMVTAIRKFFESFVDMCGKPVGPINALMDQVKKPIKAVMKLCNVSIGMNDITIPKGKFIDTDIEFDGKEIDVPSKAVTIPLSGMEINFADILGDTCPEGKFDNKAMNDELEKMFPKVRIANLFGSDVNTDGSWSGGLCGVIRDVANDIPSGPEIKEIDPKIDLSMIIGGSKGPVCKALKGAVKEFDEFQKDVEVAECKVRKWKGGQVDKNLAPNRIRKRRATPLARGDSVQARPAQGGTIAPNPDGSIAEVWAAALITKVNSDGTVNVSYFGLPTWLCDNPRRPPESKWAAAVAETVDVGTPINDLKEEKEVTTKRKKAE
uniref:Uncharacterized protein n=1 Tax=viral metagenome TaxID=1070528 RepID=A0A6C0K8A7_9ZZZZ